MTTTSHRVALSFEDGVTRFITCQPDQTVADASYRARINIPLDCRDGACGTCKAFCESGEFEHGFYIDDALSDDEADKGYCLPCQMTPKSDLVLQIASTSLVAKTQAATYSARITDLQRYSPTTVGVTLDVDKRDELAFLPGQYVNIAVPGTEESRSYSFSNAPGEQAVTFLVKLTPGGVMSTYLAERAAVGDELSVTGPNGSFFLRESTTPLLLLAGGTGLAPILSILRTLRDSGSERRVHLVYGASTDDDVVELDTLHEFESTLSNFTWDYCVADPNTSAPNTGFVTGLIAEEHLDSGAVSVYLCGPPPMVEAVRRHFDDIGVEPADFYYEKFALTGTTGGAERQDDGGAAGAPAVGATPEIPQAEAEVEVEPGPLVATVATAGGVEGGGEIPPGLTDPEARFLAGHTIFDARELDAVQGTGAPEEPEVRRTLAGRPILAAPTQAGDALPLDEDDAAPRPDAQARAITGQVLHPERALEPLAPPTAPPTGDRAPDTGPVPAPAATPRYEIGEEHPSVATSDALFDARQALELGALELTIGRLTQGQIGGYRLLAEATVPYVEGDRFLDAAGYTATNALFHDYLFTLTGNEHLLLAYQRLGVKGHMEENLRTATWCHPQCTQDHLDIVDAMEAGDRDRARELFVGHAQRSKETTRRAMVEAHARQRPAWVSPGRFTGKVVVVTGAAQGIGERVARRVSAEGGLVVLADRSELVTPLAQELSASAPSEALAAAGGGTPAKGAAVAVLADLETFEGATAAVETAIAAYGRVDVAIHNVGGTIWAKPFAEYPPDQVVAEINRSLYPTLWGCRAVLPHMIAAGGGTIVNVSSVATRGVHRVPYSAAKGGVNAITASLAMEVAPHGVRVVATAPGGTDAPPRRVARGPSASGEQEQAWYQAIVDQTVESSLLKRYGSLDEQAAAITFLASDEAAYITGTVLPVAGGDLG